MKKITKNKIGDNGITVEINKEIVKEKRVFESKKRRRKEMMIL